MTVIRIILDNLILIYALFISISYIILGLISAYALAKYIQKNRFIDYSVILSSPFAPAVSIIAPAFNESKTIIENIHALLTLHYNNFEVLVVNDGSNDDSLEKVLAHFELVKINKTIHYGIPTQNIRGIYQSTNKTYHNLTVIDKVNGGKADSLNVGINVSQFEYFMGIDVDCIIEPDALLKLVKPFMEAGTRKVIATGGTIRIINSCKVENGCIIDVKVPKNLWARFQVLEYTRAFLMGRIAWSKLNGLLLISGALGMFDKKIAIESGGYNHDTVGEDIELVVRMRRHMYEKKIKHKVEYIPNPLCWTEVPSSLKILGRQRNRWTRGTMDTLFIHRKIFFNYKYGRMGMLGYPYWFFFEWLAPIIEFIGLLYMIVLVCTDSLSWSFYLLLFAFVYLFSVAFSSYAILYEELTYQKYNKKTHVIILFFSALIEPIIYHPLTIWWAVKGNWDYMRGVKTWGNMERTGFQKK